MKTFLAARQTRQTSGEASPAVWRASGEASPAVWRVSLLSAFCSLLCLTSLWALPVVPGAYGYGMETRAAYACGSNPTVYRVTNRNDSGTGSLRAALAASGPRVVIFEVSGTITLNTFLAIQSPCVTVAGQTAPSPGITLRWVEGFTGTDGGLFILTHDVLIQHLRIRPGSSCNSALGISDYGQPIPVPYNIVLDHLSLSWAQDDNLIADHGAQNIAVWRTISSEGLNLAGGVEPCAGGSHAQGHGYSIGTGVETSIIQSLFAHNAQRNPASGSQSQVYISNIIQYDAHEGVFFREDSLISVIGSYFKRGENIDEDIAIFPIASAGAALYLDPGNVFDSGGFQPPLIPYYQGGAVDPLVDSPPITAPTGYMPMSAEAAYASVLINAGARPADRDAVDQRIIGQVQDRTGHGITSPNQVGGYPDLEVHNQPLSVPANPHAVTASGYTNLEVWLHGYAAAVEGSTPSTPACDVNQDASTNVNDVQLSANQAIGVSACLPAGQAGSADINRDGACNVIDVQRVVNAALGGTCVSP